MYDIASSTHTREVAVNVASERNPEVSIAQDRRSKMEEKKRNRLGEKRDRSKKQRRVRAINLRAAWIGGSATSTGKQPACILYEVICIERDREVRPINYRAFAITAMSTKDNKLFSFCLSFFFLFFPFFSLLSRSLARSLVFFFSLANTAPI